MLKSEQEYIFSRCATLMARHVRNTDNNQPEQATKNLNKFLELHQLILQLDLWDEYEAFISTGIVNKKFRMKEVK